MRTIYLIDDFYQTHFVIESFEKILADCYQHFALIYERIRTAAGARVAELTGWLVADAPRSRHPLDVLACPFSATRHTLGE